MELKYKKSESSVKPLPIEITQSTVYLRKEFTQETRTNERGETYAFWTYQEAKITPEEFNKYAADQAAMNAIKGANDSENISLIIENGVNSSDNQLIIMEAMADLYDLIFSMI